MKKIFTFLMLGAIFSGLLAQKQVTFKVDMNNYTGGSFTTVYVSGSFNSWSGNSNALSDADADGVWEGTFPLTDDSIEYKFTMDNWAKQESLTPGSTCTKTTGNFTNRFVQLTGNIALSKVCFESCSACTPVNNKSVTFNVNMKQYTGTYTNVYVSGNFNGWSGNSNQLTDADGDKIFSGTFDITQDSIEYKFTVDNWKDDEKLTAGSTCTKTTGQFTNRIGVVNGDSAMPAVCWEKCVSCATAGNNTIAANGVKVFPNPGSGRFNISASFSNLTSGNIEVFDVVGQKLYSKGFSGKAINTEINLNSAKPGMYLMVINTAEGSHQERIFINSK